MPGYLLHDGAIVICTHAGQAQPILKNPRVKVSSQQIVTQTCIYRITGCSNPPPPVNIGPCLTAMWMSAATRVRASGIPVLLQDSEAECVPTETPLKITLTQTRVKGM